MANGPDETEELCFNCKFWHEKMDDMGTCQKHAPRPIIDIRSTVSRFEVTWPETWFANSCGEFDRKMDKNHETI
jgi:hypothetical protein